MCYFNYINVFDEQYIIHAHIISNLSLFKNQTYFKDNFNGGKNKSSKEEKYFCFGIMATYIFFYISNTF